MSDVKWIKIVTDIFDDEKMLLIESLPSADSIIVIWFKLLCLAGKNNNSGVFLLNERIAYTEEMLATIFRRDLNTVRLALRTFEEYGMVEIINNVITIPNWSKHQTLDQLEERKNYMKNYMKKYREKQKLLVDDKTNSKVNSKVNVNSLEGEVEREEDKEVERDIDIKKYMTAWNSLGLKKLVSIKNKRLSSLKARVSEYGENKVMEAIGNINKSNFLKGNNNKNWNITFDWFLKPNNFVKVLEGNYDDKENSYSSNKNELRFNNFEPRKYDYDSLEKKLLGWAKDDE